MAKRLNINFRYETLFKEEQRKEKCTWPWRALLIGPNGNIYPCGGSEVIFNRPISTGKLYFGNLLTQRIEEFWNNSCYEKLRQSSNFTEENKSIARCSNCNSSISWLGPKDPRSHFIEID